MLDEALTANPYPTWKKLEELVDKGKIRNIGVSKYASGLHFIFLNTTLIAITASTLPG